MRSPYKYATAGLAAALFLVTALPWVWSAVGEMFVDADEANMYGRDHPDIPESWTSHRWEPSNDIEAIYSTHYDDCTLQVSKSGTGTEAVSMLSLLECSREDGGTSAIDRPDGTVEFETVPSDFEAAWTDRMSCVMDAQYLEQGDGHDSIMLHMQCGN